MFSSLGTMRGKGVLLDEPSGEIYARIYEPFGASDELRKKISSLTDGKQYLALGSDYKVGSRALQGGGCFESWELKDKEQHMLNCFAYAIGTFGSALERIAEKSIKEIQTDVMYSIDECVEKYFTPVDYPLDGDLVVYSISGGRTLMSPHSKILKGTTHAGIFRENDCSALTYRGLAGMVESKWGHWANPYVFRHDLFFIPYFYGDQAKFYTLKC